MFTGLVEEAGQVVSLTEEAQAWRLWLAAPQVAATLAQGDSLAVNGACLTVVARDGDRLAFDLLGETLRRTSFGQLRPGARVNLERSLAANARLGGHFVSGHVDATGTVTHAEHRGHDLYLRVAPPAEGLRYFIDKGSVSIDGVSLTVAEVDATGFAVWLIPHTLAVTNFAERRPGDRVNLEYDLLAKYVERLLAARGLATPAPLT